MLHIALWVRIHTVHPQEVCQYCCRFLLYGGYVVIYDDVGEAVIVALCVFSAPVTAALM